MSWGGLANVIVRLGHLHKLGWKNLYSRSADQTSVSGEGSDANHYIQEGGARLVLPVWHRIGVGAEGYVFLRRSRYSFPGFHDVDQHNPDLLVFVAWNHVR